jgi:hypothetical protein
MPAKINKSIIQLNKKIYRMKKTKKKKYKIYLKNILKIFPKKNKIKNYLNSSNNSNLTLMISKKLKNSGEKLKKK